MYACMHIIASRETVVSAKIRAPTIRVKKKIILRIFVDFRVQGPDHAIPSAGSAHREVYIRKEGFKCKGL